MRREQAPETGLDTMDEGRPFVVRRTVPRGPCPRPRPAVHAAAVLAYYTAGTARIEQDLTWTVREGDVIFIPASQPHRMLEVNDARGFGLGMLPTTVSAFDPSLLQPFERVRDGGSAVLSIPSERRHFLTTLFEELERESLNQNGSVRAMQSLVTLVIEEVERAARDAAPTDPAPREKRAGLVAESLRFIEANCLAPLGLRDVADAVGRSPAYVTTELRRATGKTAVEWIIAGRMAEARRLLRHSEESIDAISARVGYRDPTHFIRLFRRLHASSPAAWRRAHD